MTSVVLVGASGWLGGFLRLRVPDAVAVRADDVLMSDGAALDGLFGDPVVVINAAGARADDAAAFQRLNVDLPAVLAREVARSGGHLVHLGSAAEYGMAVSGGRYVEDAVAAPGSDYGRSKLEGTRRALEGGNATVLRIFNVAAAPPQPGSPLADVVERTRDGVAAGRPTELLSAGTVRDWVRVEFVCESIVHAVQYRPSGVFNVCSGVGVRMGDAVLAAMAALGSPAAVTDLGRFPPTVVIGAPERWRAVSGLGEALTATDLGGIVARAASGGRQD